MNNLMPQLIKHKQRLQAQIDGLDDLLVVNSRWNWVQEFTNGYDPVISMVNEWVCIEFNSEVGLKTVWYTNDSTYKDFQHALKDWVVKNPIYV